MLPRAHRLALVAGVALAAACTRPVDDERREAAAQFATEPWGTAMSDVARRFELAGKAELGGRFELAEYEIGELEEIFEETLPRAKPPKEGHPEVLAPMAKAFVDATMPDLAKAAHGHDRAAFAAAFEKTAKACNACHKASGHAFIEVPTAPGRSVPDTDPVAP